MDLEQALAEIERENPFVRDEEGGFHWNELREGTFAVGRCLVASRFLRDALQARGLDAWLTVDDHPSNTLELDGRQHLPEQLGIEALRDAHMRHVAVCVDTDDVIQLVDYTATQYGVDEWPLIRDTRELPAFSPGQQLGF
jgi:hypothetical protein